MNLDSTYPNVEPRPSGPRMVAVIDIGASSLRMQIAEITYPSGAIRKLESFSQAVSIGKDSFFGGRIEKKTIEDCVRVLQIYRDKLNEYGIIEPREIRVVATSGVREASNKLAFTDRIFVATGFEIEPFDEAELHRVTYLGILPFVERQEKYFAGQSIVFEAGGGTSELLYLDGRDVLYSQTYRLGSLRLRKTLEEFDAPVSKSRSLMENQIRQTIQSFQAATKDASPRNFIAMGGDVRFATKEIKQKPVGSELVELKISALEKFTDEVLSQTPDSLATKYHMSLPDAKSLGPGLLTQLLFAQELKVNKFLVANVNLRDGLIKEMAEGKGWLASIQDQMVRSAVRLAKRYKFNEAHATHVARLACSLYDQLVPYHNLPSRFRSILQIASLLHEIGYYVSSKSKHKHSGYLIRNSEFFGIGSQDLELIALVARYHRGASPQPRHDNYAKLSRFQRVAVAKLAAILRVAKALDSSYHQRVKSVTCFDRPLHIEMVTPDVEDLSVEQLELKKSCRMFADIYGKEIVLESEGNEQ